MKKLIFTICALVFTQGCFAQTNSFEYFGQTPPGNTPIVFAPGFISLDNRNESFFTFSPDGKECFFTEHAADWNGNATIMQTIYHDNTWSKPINASFSANQSLCPSISPDGTKLFFIKDGGVFQCLHTSTGSWSEPVEMDRPISSGQNELSCHLSDKGTMYVCSWRAGGKGGCDGWRIPFSNRQDQKAENLGSLNSKVGDCCWAPGPNEEYLIFQSRRPPTGGGGGFFNTDLFITFACPGRGWSAPRNLGPKINSSATDGSASISHDGKYLFFSSNRRGTFDIYWVSLDSILMNRDTIPINPKLGINTKDRNDYFFYQKTLNPSDRSTTLQFDLKKPGNSTLSIYTLTGEKMGIVMNEFKDAGSHQFVWDGKGYPKGEYLCELQVSEVKSERIFLESTIQILLR